MKNIKNIIFDLDGTLIDPQEGIINSVLYALQKSGIEEKKPEELNCFIGPPLIDSFSKRYNLSTEEAGKAVKYYREYFSKKGIFQTVLYEGVEKTLKSLTANGFSLFIATSKPTYFAKQIIAYHTMEALFTEIAGSNLDNTRKEKKQIIDFVIKKHHLNRKETIMVGDTKYDIIGAKNNSITAIGVSYGYGNIRELDDANCDLIINNFSELNQKLSF